MIFSILAFITLTMSVCVKERHKSLAIQAASCMFEAIYDFVISAFTGAVLNVINFIRTCLFINKNKFTKRAYFILLLVFETLIVVNCFFTWKGIISLLPTTASMIRTYCLWQPEMKYVRISGITTGILYGYYYLLYNGWFMVLGYLILLIAGIYAVYSNDIKKTDRLLNTQE